MLVVAVEGPACAGKTTLIRHLCARLPHAQSLPDYAEVASSLTDMPAAPSKTVEEELNGLRFFLAIDRLRWHTVIRSPHEDQHLVLLDRSVHTLLAHRYAIEHMTLLPVFEPALKIVMASQINHHPSIVLYLDVPQSELSRRHRLGDGRDGTIFLDPSYNRFFRSYFFLESAPFLERPYILDGRRQIPALIDKASAILGGN